MRVLGAETAPPAAEGARRLALIVDGAETGGEGRRGDAE
jgi:hypothetical protein